MTGRRPSWSLASGARKTFLLYSGSRRSRLRARRLRPAIYALDAESAESDAVHVGRKLPMEHLDDPWTIALIIVLLLMFAVSGYAITMEVFKWLRE